MANNFALDLRRACEKAKDKADLVVRAVVLGVGKSLVERSPVGNPDLWKSKAPKGYVGGRFRANWQYGESDVPEGVVNAIDDNGKATIDKIASIVAAEAAGKRHFIVNNLPYAQVIEYGHSSQAPGPGGVVGLTVVQFRDIVEAAAAEVKSK